MILDSLKAAASRWLDLLENPFFLKEARALSRRNGGPVGALLVRQVFFLCLPLLLCERWLPWGPRDGHTRQIVALGLLLAGHGLFCAVTGSLAGLTVLRDEHRWGTLDSLRLLPTPPWRWLLQKLLFPLYAVALVWLAGLPFYAALAVRGHFLPSQLLPGAQWALEIGLFGFAGALSMPPEGVRGVAEGARGMLARRSLEAGQLLLGWVGLCLVRFGVDGLLWVARLHSAPWKSTTPVFGVWIRVEHYLTLLVGTYALAAVATAISAAAPDNLSAQRRARAARYLAGGVGYALMIGGLPASVPLWTRLPLLALLPLATFMLLRQARRDARPQIDALATNEIRWCGSRWDNAVLIRDLRSALRLTSVRRSLLVRCGELVGFAFALAALSLVPAVASSTAYLYGNQTSAAALLSRTLAHLAFASPFWTLFAGLLLGSRARERWLQETEAGTLPQLLATPLPAAALVRGRWAASALAGMAWIAPALLCAASGAALMVTTRASLLLPYLALLLVNGSTGILGGAETARSIRPGTESSGVQTLQGLAGLLCAIVDISVGGLLGAGILACLIAGSAGEQLPALSLLAVLVTGVNLWLTGRCFHRSVAELGQLRIADIG